LNVLGATAAVVVIKKEENTKTIYSANCGDARAVLVFICYFLPFSLLFIYYLYYHIFRKKDGGFLRLSTDHKPTLPDEVERIVANGGFVAMGRVNGLSFLFIYILF
jgi:serine/threonine protein phosphatase PrpC